MMEEKRPKECSLIAISVFHEPNLVRKKIAMDLILKFEVEHGFIKRKDDKEIEISMKSNVIE